MEWTGLSEQQFKKIAPLVPTVKIKGYKIRLWHEDAWAKILQIKQTS